VKQVLLTFIGNNDCRLSDSVPGPILTILDRLRFDGVYLLYNHDRYLKPAAELVDYCRRDYPGTRIRFQAAPAVNPTDYNTVYPAMFQAVSAVLQKEPEAEFTISLTSGTPVMHACWVFLRQGGVIPARLIQVSLEDGISDVLFDLDDFPEIQQPATVKAEMTRLARENRALRNRMGLALETIVGESPPILRMKERIEMFAAADIPVLIRGETGTGKELVAEALHFGSGRKEKTLVRVNCGAIPAELFESAFFGHKKGSFTGAIGDHEGFLRQADGGTLFLDEIADLPLAMQVKLLRFLDGGGFMPVGKSREEKADVRVVAASNRDLREEVREKRFREDLFYRLATVEIVVPPLRDRAEDKARIARHLLERLNSKYRERKGLSASAVKRILSHDWPGNVRQLKSALEAGFLAARDEIQGADIPIVEIGRPSCDVILPEDGVDLNHEVLPAYYRAALERTGGNAEKAAGLLGLKPHTFRARLKGAGVKIFT
jgi:DNA-binding NtrC family response regulator